MNQPKAEIYAHLFLQHRINGKTIIQKVQNNPEITPLCFKTLHQPKLGFTFTEFNKRGENQRLVNFCGEDSLD